MDDIANTLERQLILKRFNREQLKMSEVQGSTLNQVIGMGVRRNIHTNELDALPNIYPSYFKNVLRAFEVYPITKTFGISVKDAMALPVNEWHSIRKSAQDAFENQPPSLEGQISELVDTIREMIAFQAASAGITRVTE